MAAVEKKWYLGIGQEFVKAQCKEYKTLEGAKKAAAKNPDFVVWDENGNKVDMDAAAGASTEGAEGANEEKAEENTPEAEKAADGANTSAEGGEVIVPDGEMRVTVVCDGSLNLRRSAAWGNDNICGRATRGQQYHVRKIHVVKGKKMVETIDGLFLSGDSEHVQFEQL